MRSNRKILFGLLLILGAFGFYRLFRYVSAAGSAAGRGAGNTPAKTAGVQPVSVNNSAGRIAEARMTIPANTIVTPDMLRMVPNDSTEGYVTDIESQAAGYITRVTIPVGGKLRVGDKFEEGGDFIGHVSETGIAGLLRPGTRAMVIPLANKPTLHDLVRIGNFVDVLAAFDGQESRTIVQNVRVLGVDLSANDYPNVNVAMRGPSKAQDKGGAQPVGTPGTTPTPSPNAPKPDPAITLEVTPQQAATLQLAVASNATLDYLVRPALPGNRSAEVVPVDGATGEPTLQTVSVTKPQIAPYAERRKNAGGGASVGGGKNSSNGGGTRLVRGGGLPPDAIGPTFPTPIPVGPAKVGGGSEVALPMTTPVPTPTQNYSIPVYGDGHLQRTEVVPLPAPSR